MHTLYRTTKNSELSYRITMSTGETNKRVRIDESQNTINTTTTTTTSPTAIALSNLSTKLLSLPYKPVQDSLKTLGAKYLQQQVKANSKLLLINRMENDEDYVPKSARSNFKLTAMKPVEGLDEFATLQTNVQEATKAYQNAMKTAIISAAKLEHKQLVATCRTTFFEGVKLIGINMVIMKQGPMSKLDQTLIGLLDRYANYIEGLQLTKEEAIAQHKATHTTTAPADANDAVNDMEITVVNVDTNTTQTQTTQTQLSQEAEVVLETPMPAPIVNDIQEWINSVLLHPILRHRTEVKQKSVALELLTTNKQLTQTKVTEDADNLLNEEGAMDAKTMMELIKKETMKANKPIVNQLTKLEKSLSKNSKRGQSNTGASKKSPKQSKKQLGKSSTTSKDTDKKKPASTQGNNDKGTNNGKQNKNNNKSRNRSNTRPGKKERARSKSPGELKKD